MSPFKVREFFRIAQYIAKNSQFKNWLPLICSLFLLNHTAFADPNFDRVFTTKQQRIFLDKLRLAEPEKNESEELVITPEMATEIVASELEETLVKEIKTPRVNVTGLFVRHDGETGIWSDQGFQFSGEPIGNNAAIVKTHLGGPQSGIVQIVTSDTKKTMQPGQTWMLEEDQVVETYFAKTLAIEENTSMERTAETKGVDSLDNLSALSKIDSYNKEVNNLEKNFQGAINTP